MHTCHRTQKEKEGKREEWEKYEKH